MIQILLKKIICWAILLQGDSYIIGWTINVTKQKYDKESYCGTHILLIGQLI